MARLRIALGQVNTRVGDLAGNAETILDVTGRAFARGARVIAFPEMALTGYPVEDLALRQSFAEASRRTMDGLAGRIANAGCADALVVVGYLDQDDTGPRNAAALIHGGHVVTRYNKHHLPNYGVFDEFRYFKPGSTLPIVRFSGVDIGTVICEDIWQEGGPIAALRRAGVDAVLCLNGSPYERSKDDQRLPLVRRRAAEAGATMAYVNLVGGQDELVFDGDSLVMSADGELLARAPQFAEHLLVTDVELPSARHSSPGTVNGFRVDRIELGDRPAPGPSAGVAEPVGVAEPLSEEAEVWAALVTGLRDYARKNRFRSVVLGLSGGIDSAVCAALAVDALGPDAVHAVSMPSAYSSEHSSADALELARRTGLHFQVQPIAGVVSAFVEQLELRGLAEENIQARCRGAILMALSNQHGHLVLATGNKTELSVGYSTIYGDAVGGFAPIKDVPKTLVWRLARWRDAEAEKRGEPPPIPENSIAKPPSAELRPGQLDADSLPPYELLDGILDDYVEADRGYHSLVDAGFAPEVVERVLQLVDGAEYKRRQYPPGTKITLKAFGRDRRVPITSAWREHQAHP